MSYGRPYTTYQYFQIQLLEFELIRYHENCDKRNRTTSANVSLGTKSLSTVIAEKIPKKRPASIIYQELIKKKKNMKIKASQESKREEK